MLRTRPFALAALCALALGASARADVIAWGYTTTLAAPGATDPSTGSSPLTITADSPAGGQVKLYGGSMSNGMGSSDFVPVSIQIASATTGTNNLTTAGGYTLFVQLNDQSSGTSGTLAFQGKLGGSFTPDSAGLLTSTLYDPATQSLTLGSHLYTVTIGGYVPPSPPGAMNTGSIGGHVTVADVANVPEPTALLLAGLGACGGVLGWKRRRAARKSAAAR